jgi:hypothetical protein
VGLVLPRCNTKAMTLHLAEISQAVKKGAYAVVILDQAGWHGAKDLEVPDNITPLLLRMEPAHPTALEDHVHRTARLDPCMINFRIWYYAATDRPT